MYVAYSQPSHLMFPTWYQSLGFMRHNHTKSPSPSGQKNETLVTEEVYLVVKVCLGTFLDLGLLLQDALMYNHLDHLVLGSQSHS